MVRPINNDTHEEWAPSPLGSRNRQKQGEHTRPGTMHNNVHELLRHAVAARLSKRHNGSDDNNNTSEKRSREEALTPYGCSATPRVASAAEATERIDQQEQPGEGCTLHPMEGCTLHPRGRGCTLHPRGRGCTLHPRGAAGEELASLADHPRPLSKQVSK